MEAPVDVLGDARDSLQDSAFPDRLVRGRVPCDLPSEGEIAALQELALRVPHEDLDLLAVPAVEHPHFAGHFDAGYIVVPVGDG